MMQFLPTSRRLSLLTTTTPFVATLIANICRDRPVLLRGLPLYAIRIHLSHLAAKKFWYQITSRRSSAAMSREFARRYCPIHRYMAAAPASHRASCQKVRKKSSRCGGKSSSCSALSAPSPRSLASVLRRAVRSRQLPGGAPTCVRTPTLASQLARPTDCNPHAHLFCTALPTVPASHTARTSLIELVRPSETFEDPSLARPTYVLASLRHITRTLPSENRCFRSGTRPHPSRLSRLSKRQIAHLRGWYAYTKPLPPQSTSGESFLRAQGAQICRVPGNEAYTALSGSGDLVSGASRSHRGETSLQSGLEASITARRAPETGPAAFFVSPERVASRPALFIDASRAAQRLGTGS